MHGICDDPDVRVGLDQHPSLCPSRSSSKFNSVSMVNDVLSIKGTVTIDTMINCDGGLDGDVKCLQV